MTIDALVLLLYPFHHRCRRLADSWTTKGKSASPGGSLDDLFLRQIVHELVVRTEFVPPLSLSTLLLLLLRQVVLREIRRLVRPSVPLVAMVP